MPATVLAVVADQRAQNLLDIRGTIPSVLAAGTSPLYALAVKQRAGTIAEIGVAIGTVAVPVDAEVTLSLFDKDDAAAGELNEIVRMELVRGNPSAKIRRRFINADSPAVATLYLKMTHTAGLDATGAVPFYLILEL